MHWPVVVQMGSPDERIERLLMTLTQTQFASLNNVLQSRCCAQQKTSRRSIVLLALREFVQTAAPIK